MIRGFRGENYFLSNMFEAFITVDGILYKNAESAYQAQKVKSRAQRIKHFTGKSGFHSKQFGKKVMKNDKWFRKDWDNVKYDIMYNIVYEKFKQNLSLRRKLLNTQDKELIEINQWHDGYWGNCICDKCGKHGENNLGKILMNVRDCFKKLDSEGFEF